MSYRGFVDSQVMSLFEFSTRGCVKKLYECPFFAENKESHSEQGQKQNRGWFLTEKVSNFVFSEKCSLMK